MIVAFSDTEFNNAKSNDGLKLICERCGKTFNGLKRYVKHELTHNRGRLKYCSSECASKKLETKKQCKCACCGKEIYIKNSEAIKSKSGNHFCSKSCSARYNNKKRLNEQRKCRNCGLMFDVHQGYTKTLCSVECYTKYKKEHNHNNRYKERVCKVCGKTYTRLQEGSTLYVCSKDCSIELKRNRKMYLSSDSVLKISNGAKKSVLVQSENRRSKNEKLFCKLCEEHFTNVENNKPIFNGWDADVIIHDIKVAILWNGKWHYEKITKKHSVEQVQNRDNIKIKEITNSGYIPYVIKDMGKYNKEFVENEFNKFLKFIKS